MIRSIPTGAAFSYRKRNLQGAGAGFGMSLQFNPITAGIGAGVSLATSAAAMWMNSIQTSHNADTATTLIVNGLAEQLQNLKDAYLSEPNPSCADQRAALDAYDSAWLWLQSPQGCGAPSFGRAGNACITDRAPAGRFPWRTYYRDPIANDPRMAAFKCDTGNAVYLPSITTGSYASSGITSTGGSSATGQPNQSAAPTGYRISDQPIDFGTPTTSPNYLYIGAAALGAVLLLKATNS